LPLSNDSNSLGRGTRQDTRPGGANFDEAKRGRRRVTSGLLCVCGNAISASCDKASKPELWQPTEFTDASTCEPPVEGGFTSIRRVWLWRRATESPRPDDFRNGCSGDDASRGAMRGVSFHGDEAIS